MYYVLQTGLIEYEKKPAVVLKWFKRRKPPILLNAVALGAVRPP